MERRALQREHKRQWLQYQRQQKRKRRWLLLCFSLILGAILIYGIKTTQITTIDSKEAIKKGNKMGEEIEIKAKNSKMMTSEDLQKGELILVNESCPLRFYEEIELRQIVGNNDGLYRVRSVSTRLQPQVLTALNEMIGDFTRSQGKNEIGVISGYRTFEEQERLHYEAYRQQQEGMDTFVAKPDRSEHHTGLAVDLGIYHEDGTSDDYDGTGIYQWITDHCYAYGFIVRYKEEKKEQTGIGDEPWHLRYVGAVHAAIMKELDLCLEEYIVYLKNYRYYTNPLQWKGEGIGSFSIYYVPATGYLTEVPLPESKPYKISGDNKEGFIVTVKLN